MKRKTLEIFKETINNTIKEAYIPYIEDFKYIMEDYKNKEYKEIDDNFPNLL